MRSQLVPVLLLFLSLALVLPPWVFFLRSIARMRRKRDSSHQRAHQIVLVVATIAVTFNTFYLILLFAAPGSVQIQAGWGLYTALFFAWVSLWGRWALVLFTRKSRNLHP